MPTYRELKEKAEKLMAEAEKLRHQETQQVIAEIQARMREYGLTVRDITTPELQAKGSTFPNPPKYRGPNGELWAGGRGRKPDWVRELLDQGKDLEDYRI